MQQTANAQHPQSPSLLEASFQANPDLVSLEARDIIIKAIKGYEDRHIDPRPVLQTLNVPIKSQRSKKETYSFLRQMQSVINRRLMLQSKKITTGSMVELGSKQYRVTNVAFNGIVELDGHRGGFNPNNLRLVQPAQSTQN